MTLPPDICTERDGLPESFCSLQFKWRTSLVFTEARHSIVVLSAPQLVPTMLTWSFRSNCVVPTLSHRSSPTLLAVAEFLTEHRARQCDQPSRAGRLATSERRYYGVSQSIYQLSQAINASSCSSCWSKILVAVDNNNRSFHHSSFIGAIQTTLIPTPQAAKSQRLFFSQRKAVPVPYGHFWTSV